MQSIRRLARLEKLVEPYRQRRKENDKAAQELLVTLARDHAITLAALLLHGEPQLKEPLEVAFQRCLDKFPAGYLSYISVCYVPTGPSLVLGSVLKELPGETETEKFQFVFDIAPPWLLKFTFAEITALYLKLKCPDYSSAPHEGQTARSQLLRWPYLPHGTLQGGGRVRSFDERNYTEEERREIFEGLEELIREIRMDMIKDGDMPDFKVHDVALSIFPALGADAVRSRLPKHKSASAVLVRLLGRVIALDAAPSPWPANPGLRAIKQ